MTAEARRKTYIKHAILTRSNTTGTALFTLPRGAYIEDIIVHNSVAAAGATISIGTTLATPTEFVSAQSVATAGLNRVTCVGTYAATSTRVTVYGLIAGGAVAGGPFRVAVHFTTARDKGHI